MPFLDHLQALISYLPISLFAESLRVQRTLVSAVMNRHSVAGGLTGCIKDLHKLWEIDEFELLGQFHDETASAVVSVRHGNTFPLVNKAVLASCSIIGRKSSTPFISETGSRVTTVNISFVTPTECDIGSRLYQRWKKVIVFLVFFLESVTAIGLSIALWWNGLPVGTLLLACQGFCNLLMFVLRLLVSPIFANQHALHRDRALGVSGGGALDVHVIAENWNSSRLDVICGFSSQLHSLTNIPIRIHNTMIVRWTCRLLLVALVVQAAALASMTNAIGVERWSGVVWLAMYFLLGICKRILHFRNPESILEEQPATIHRVDPLHFSGRTAALAFIAALPVSHKMDRWAYWDVFMPNNERRRKLQTELEVSSVFKDQPFENGNHKVSFEDNTSLPNQSGFVEKVLEEVRAGLEHPSLVTFLKDFQNAVLVHLTPQDVEV